MPALKKLITLLLTSFITQSSSEEQRPNIVLFFIDDWAWNGSPVPMDDDMPNSRMPVLQMPHVEQLAREGMKFRNAYASPQCSPSRVCLQTGQSSPRNGFTVFSNSMGQDYYNEKKSKGLPVISCISDMTIDPNAVTIPEALKPLGYVSAHIGKWHMRGNPGDEGYLVHDGDTSNKPGNTIGTSRRLPDDLTDPKLMFSLTDRSLKFLESQAKAKQPFYLQISHYAMHEGRECLPATRLKYAKDPAVQAYYKKVGETAETINRKKDPAIWLGMAEDMDGRIGAVLDKLKELGIEDKTYVVMLSDNGYRHSFLPGHKQPMHAHKWWVWQGGVRVPMIIKGPGIKAGATFQPNVINYDLLPTFVDWAGGTPKELKKIDGRSLAPYLKGKSPKPEFLNRRLYFHYPHNRTSMPHSAMVSGTTKIIHFYERPDLPMMFDLSTDEGEVHNIATKQPDKYKKLFNEMMSYFKEVGARIPKKNPDFKPGNFEQSKQYQDIKSYGPFAGSRPLADDEK